jgi:ligand-binding sensor domain-containing protein/tRNA A-37 threonylcarbamoyl transferase component Bud32
MIESGYEMGFMKSRFRRGIHKIIRTRYAGWMLAGLMVGTLCIFSLDSQKKISQYVNRQWKEADGMSVSMITSLAQTGEGYLWIGTQGGLIRFDGVKFLKFNTQNTGEIKVNYINTLFADSGNMLWIGTRLGLVNFKDGRFFHLRGSEVLSDDIIYSIYEDQQHRVWIGSELRGLTCFHNQIFEAFNPDINSDLKSVHALTGDKSGTLWVGTVSGLYRFGGGAWKALLEKESLTGKVISVSHMLAEDDGNLWLGTNRGLVRFKNGVFTFFSHSGLFPPHHIRFICREKNGVIWIGTDGAGMFQWHGDQFARFGKQDGLTGNMVYAILEDRDGSLWVGTYSGLNQMVNPRVVTFTSNDGLSDDTVWSVCEDARGRIWFATNGGICSYQDNRFTAYDTGKGLSSMLASCVYPTRDGSLWIGIYNSWLHRLNNNSFSQFSIKTGNAIMDAICFCEDSRGFLWIGTAGNGLYRYRSGKFDHFTEKEGCCGNHIFSLCEHRGGGLWIGTDGSGLGFLKNGRFSAFDKKDGLSSNIIMALFEDDQGILWIGTEGGGLNRFEGGKITAFAVKEGLEDDVVYGILEDQDLNLWLSGNNGISRISKRALNALAAGEVRMVFPENFGISDGMKALECSGGYQPSGWKTKEGKLWFATIKGAVMIDPLNLEAEINPPPVVIENVFLDGKAVEFRHKRIDVNPGIHKIEIYFTAPSFISPKKIDFRYKLEGYEKAWFYPGNRKDRIATYTNISPGKYRFRVMARNGRNQWNEPGARVDFMIYPPFWRTWWFISLSLFVFSILSYLIIHFARKYVTLITFWRKKNYIGHFRIGEKIASGGMGTIYRASDVLNHNKFVALKVLRDELSTDSVQRKRFINEGSIIDQIDHPNIVKVLERGEHNNQLYIAMELLEGMSLGALIREKGRIPVAEAVEIMVQLVDVLDKIHSKGIFHRDLKPENIMLQKTEKTEYFVKLLDFGLAKTESLSRLTETGMVIGTIGYIPPEQITEGKFSADSDVYSLGIILYEMLTGKKPFTGDTTVEVMKKIIYENPVNPSEYRSDIPPGLDQLIMNMIEKNPSCRPALDTVWKSLIGLIDAGDG